MADKLSQLILEALSRSASDPPELPLYTTKAAVGLFPATTVGKAAAARCLELGYLRITRNDTSGKQPRDFAVITDTGLTHLLSQVSPKQVLEDFVRALEARQAQVEELLQAARRMQDHVAGMKAAAEHVLPRLQWPTELTQSTPNTSAPQPAVDVVAVLSEWHATADASDDCPLPELYRRIAATHPVLSIGCFHDHLRQLHDREQVWLHPWTGPLYELPEPQYALLVGHEIAYYASVRLTNGTVVGPVKMEVPRYAMSAIDSAAL